MRHNERIPWRIPALLTAMLCIGVGITYCDRGNAATAPPPFDSTTQGYIVVNCDGGKISQNTVESEATAAALNYAINHGGKANCSLTYPIKLFKFAIPAVQPTPAPTPAPTPTPTPTPTPQALALQFATAVGGTYAPLNGAAISGKITVKLSDCSQAGPWEFAIDGVVSNTESQCPFSWFNDDVLWDSSTVSNGAHVLTARNGSQTISAVFITSNSGAAKPNGSATLAWQPPTQNTDDSPLTDLAGYVVKYGLSCAALDKSVVLDGAGLTTYVVQGLSPGTWCFAVSAYNSANVQSWPSNTATKTI